MKLFVVCALLCLATQFASRADAEDYDMDWRKYGPVMPKELQEHPLFSRNYKLSRKVTNSRSRFFRFAMDPKKDAEALADYGKPADKSKKVDKIIETLELKSHVFRKGVTFKGAADFAKQYETFLGEMENLQQEDFNAAVKTLGALNSALGKDKAKVWARGLALLNFQNSGDPYFFVAHSAAHGIRVSQFIHQVYKELDKLKAFDGSGLTLGNAMLTGLIHDCGYAATGALQGEKWPHALAGATMIRHYMDFDTIGDQGLSSDLNRNAIIHSVARHNYDKYFGDKATDAYTPGCKFNAQSQTWELDWSKSTDDEIDLGTHGHSRSGVLSKTGKLLLFKKPTDVAKQCPWGNSETHGTLLKRDYTPAELVTSDPKDPNLFLLRMADNFDAQRRRLGKFQRSWQFMALLAGMYVSDDFRKKTPTRKKQDLTTLKSSYFSKNHVQQLTDAFKKGHLLLDPKIPGVVQAIAWFNEESFLHFFSNYIIESLDVQVKTLDKWVLTVTLHVGQDNADPAKFAADLPFATYYQIWRAAEALKSLTVNKKPLTDVIHITIQQNSKVIHKEVPLRIFNPKAFKGTKTCNDDLSEFQKIYKYDSKKKNAPMFTENYNGITPTVDLMADEGGRKVGEHSAAFDIKC